MNEKGIYVELHLFGENPQFGVCATFTCNNPGCKKQEERKLHNHGMYVADICQVEREFLDEGWTYQQGAVLCPECTAKGVELDVH